MKPVAWNAIKKVPRLLEAQKHELWGLLGLIQSYGIHLLPDHNGRRTRGTMLLHILTNDFIDIDGQPLWNNNIQRH
ncbi:MAG: hypothetical protein ABIP64_06825, partial [Burkholderiales bacterium]